MRWRRSVAATRRPTRRRRRGSWSRSSGATTYLEDMPVADTVAVLQELAEPRGLAAALDSPLLPPAP